MLFNKRGDDMPPKAKYTKEQILHIAYEFVRKEGIENLTARNLAKELGTSTAPIFTAFKNIEELQEQVNKRAWELYSEYIKKGMEFDIPFKGTGLMYIRFAKDEPKLFKMLFMRGNGNNSPSHYFPAGDNNEPAVRGTIEDKYGLDKERAKKLYNHLSVYVHGIAVMYADGLCVFTDEDVSRMMSEIFMALTKGEKI